jgi:hypothetical protein
VLGMALAAGFEAEPTDSVGQSTPGGLNGQRL